MKKVIPLIMVMVMCLGLAACGTPKASPAPTSPSGGENPAPSNATEANQKYKIAILEAALNDESVIRANYFKNYVGPKYNIEFMFSEACSTTEAAMTFIENAADAGCQAIINYYPTDVEQQVQLAREYSIIMSINVNRNARSESTFTGGYDNFVGGFAANQKETGKLFRDYLVENLSADEAHGFVVTTGSAYNGAEQQFEISVNMLEALQDIYGLTFETKIEDLVTSSSPVEAKNDKGLDIYVYPGMSSQDGWLQGLSSALQTGKYDYCLYSRQDFVDTAVTVSEIEKSYNKDVTVVTFGSFGESLTNAFNTKDNFGNASINMSNVKFTSLVSAMGFVQVYNGLTNHADVIKNAKGEPADTLFKMQAVTSAEQLEEMSAWDKDGKWVGDYDLIDSCLGINNSELTAEKIQQNFDAVTYEAIKERLK